jgi:hypothetical protein
MQAGNAAKGFQGMLQQRAAGLWGGVKIVAGKVGHVNLLIYLSDRSRIAWAV